MKSPAGSSGFAKIDHSLVEQFEFKKDGTVLNITVATLKREGSRTCSAVAKEKTRMQFVGVSPSLSLRRLATSSRVVAVEGNPLSRKTVLGQSRGLAAMRTESGHRGYTTTVVNLKHDEDKSSEDTRDLVTASQPQVFQVLHNKDARRRRHDSSKIRHVNIVTWGVRLIQIV
jgi:hypothetical protein